jgi:hypothetical protein
LPQIYCHFSGMISCNIIFIQTRTSDLMKPLYLNSSINCNMRLVSRDSRPNFAISLEALWRMPFLRRTISDVQAGCRHGSPPLRNRPDVSIRKGLDETASMEQIPRFCIKQRMLEFGSSSPFTRGREARKFKRT